jgi:hypothetical protein
MSFNDKSGYGLSGPIATTVALGVVLGSLMAQSAQAQTYTGPRPTVSGVVGATPPGNSYANCNAATLAFYPLDQQICSNGATSTLAFPLLVGGVPDSTPPGLLFTYGPGLFNYAGRGTGVSITSFITNTAAAGNGVNSPASVPPFSFASTDAPLTQAQLNSYFSLRVNSGAGFGPVVELPYTASSIAVLYNTNGGGTAPNANATIVLTRNQECIIFNGGSVTVNTPAGVAIALNRGVRDSAISAATFITTNHLNTVCRPLGLWSYTNAAGNQVSRGFGQVSLAQNSAACQAATAALPNTVCWPSAFLTGTGDGGIAAQVTFGGAGTFGYVGFSTAASLLPIPGNDASVDADLLTSNNPSNRVFANTDIARLTNASGTVVTAVAANISDALLAATDLSAADCRIVYNLPDPTAGYPIVGVNYLLFYGDYTPDDETIFGGRGNALRDRYQLFVLNAVSDTALADAFGYSALPPAVQNDVIDAAFKCIQAVPFPNTNTLDSSAASRLAP